jgi:YidC/Oxa1 family membrane protein insertase
MDFQRTVLWVIFAMSLLFLWDNWQRSQGKASMFGGPAPTAQVDKKAAAPANGGVPAQAPAQTPAQAPASAAGAAPADVPPPQAAARANGAAPGVPDVNNAAGAAPAPRAAEPVRIETDLVRFDIDPNGAVVTRVELKKQHVAPDWTASGLLSLFTGKKQDKDANVVLLEQTATRVYLAQSGVIGGDGFPNHRTAFTPLPGPREFGGGQDKLEVKFAAEGGGLRVVKTYVFERSRYDVELRHEVTNTGAAPVNASVYLQLMRDGNKPEGESALYYTYTGPAIYSEQDKFRKIDFADIEKGKAAVSGPSKQGWVGMIQHYFVSAWVPPSDVTREFYANKFKDNLYFVGTKYALPAVAPGATVASSAKLFVGPQDQNALEKLAPGLDLVVDYGWLTFIAKPLFWLLEFLHKLVGNWGWAIVLLTVIVKAAFYPLSAASYKSMARMKEVTPRLMKLREQYGDDKRKLNVAMMELYKNEKINPVGGCLPILVQIPVFIALYWVLLASVEMRNAPWMLWVKDLATPDPWFVLPVVMMGTMFVQYKLNPTPPDPVQARVMMLMPFIFGIMFFLFPAGLVLYWLVNNVLSIAQQWYVTKQIAKAKPVG